MTTDDERIKKDVVEQLFWDSRLDASQIKVEVCAGQVTLTGSIFSYASKKLAEKDAQQVNGVLDVENKLNVQTPSSLTPSDAILQSQIETLFEWDPDMNAQAITVSVTDGLVTLTGTVDTYSKKIKAEETASDMSGVAGIVNELAVVPTTNYLDQSIAKDIVAALDRNSKVEADSIDIKVEKGKVTISGGAPNWAAYRAALDTVNHTAGVVDVINHLHKIPAEGGV